MFESHKLNEQGFAEMKAFKSNFAVAVQKALDMMPEGREKNIFKTELEKAVFFGAKAIAGKEGNYTEITSF